MLQETPCCERHTHAFFLNATGNMKPILSETLLVSKMYHRQLSEQ